MDETEQRPDDSPESSPLTSTTEPVISQSEQPVPPDKQLAPPKKPRAKLYAVCAIVLILLAFGVGIWFGGGHFGRKKVSMTAAKSSKSPAAKAQVSTTTVQGLQLDSSKNYGDKYANGLLPVGDGKYTTSAPKQGYVYACSDYARNLSVDGGGAMVRGPWFTDGGKEYNVNKKLHVEGNVMWQADFTNTVSGDTRTIVTNDLPSHPTGIFPILSSDPAYSYDRNPNSIKGQTFTYQLAADPTYNTNPNCIGGEVGIMLTGVALFSAFDAGGRDAGAWEVQDSCNGHPQSDGIYHYHTLSSCIKNVSVHTVIGYALDGFPITGPDVGTGNVLNSGDLDVCHGIVSQIYMDGKSVTMYHYVMTQDFPYSVSCYRGKAINPPGQQEQQQTQQAGQGAAARQPPPRP